MDNVKLEMSKLLGYRLVDPKADETTSAEAIEIKMGVKVGGKAGRKAG